VMPPLLEEVRIALGSGQQLIKRIARELDAVLLNRELEDRTSVLCTRSRAASPVAKVRDVLR
jgi:hypothetical protein